MNDVETSAMRGRDWVGDPWSYLLAWGLPTLAVVLGAFTPAPARTVIWTVALVWKGGACVANSRRCRRTHCRYTGPFYLLLTLPVLLHGSGMVSFGPYGWFALGAAILLGGKAIWLATERAWGKFEPHRSTGKR